MTCMCMYEYSLLVSSSHVPLYVSHRDDYFAYSQTSAGALASNGYMRLKSGSSSGSLIQSQLTHRYTQPHITEWSIHTHHSIYKMCCFFILSLCSLLCFSNAVTLQCIGKLLCSLWHTWNNNVNPQNLILFIWTPCFQCKKHFVTWMSDVVFLTLKTLRPEWLDDWSYINVII